MSVENVRGTFDFLWTFCMNHTSLRLIEYKEARIFYFLLNLPPGASCKVVKNLTFSHLSCKEFHIPRNVVNFKNVATSSRNIFAWQRHLTQISDVDRISLACILVCLRLPIPIIVHYYCKRSDYHNSSPKHQLIFTVVISFEIFKMGDGKNFTFYPSCGLITGWFIIPSRYWRDRLQTTINWNNKHTDRHDL